jgi:hypothetical protein
MSARRPTPTQAAAVGELEDLLERLDALVARSRRAWRHRPDAPEHALLWFVALYGGHALALYREAALTGARLRPGEYIPGTLTLERRPPPAAKVTSLAEYRARHTTRGV